MNNPVNSVQLHLSELLIIQPPPNYLINLPWSMHEKHTCMLISNVMCVLKTGNFPVKPSFPAAPPPTALLQQQTRSVRPRKHLIMHAEALDCWNAAYT